MIERLLIVIPDFPCPPIAGSHLRDLQHICVLSDLGVKPSLFSFLAREDGPPYQFESLNGRLRDVNTVKRVFPRGNVVRVKVTRNLRYLLPLRSVRGGYEKCVYPNAIPYDAADGGERVVALINALKPQAVLLRSCFIHYLPLIKALGVKAVVDAHDCESHIAYEIFRAHRNPLLKLGALCAYVAAKRQERRYLPWCDELWETSEEAVIRVRKSVGEALSGVNAFALPSTLDLSRYPLPPPHLEEADVLLSVGNMSLVPNANAAERLVTEIFPEVRKRRRNATLCIVGGGAPERVLRAARQTPGIGVVGFAQDLAEHYARAAVVVVTVEEGNGILLKTLEAMAFGKAVVSSMLGVEGIGVVNGVHAVVARTTEEYVQGICQLLDRLGERRRFGRNARQLIDSRYSWTAAKRIMRERSILFSG